MSAAVSENRRYGVFLLISLLVLALLPWWGAESLSWKDVFTVGSPDHRIFFELRLPRFLFAVLVGGALTLLGATYQTLFHNALAEPYVLGVSSAVTLGLVLAEVVFKSNPHSVLAVGSGTALALALTLLLVLFSSSRFGRDPNRLVLFGMGMNFVLSSLLFLVLSYHNQHMGGGSQRWLFGQIPWLSKREVSLVWAISIPLLFTLWLWARRLDALSFGDLVARSLGTNPHRARTLFLLVSSVLLVPLVYYSGAIGFVGLVVPHATRLLFRPPTTRLLFTASFFVGAVFVAGADLISRSILPPFEFPIGIITTLVGGPLFLFLLVKR